MQRIAVTVIALGACTSSAPDRTPAADPAPSAAAPEQATSRPKPASAPVSTAATDEESGMEITWTLSGAGDKLVVEYTVRNNSDATVWVATRLMQNTPSGRVMKPVDRLIVRDGDTPEVVSLVRGMTYESLPKGRERPAPSPEMAELEPSHSLSGRAEVPLPLEAWHNYGALPPLEGTKTKAVLELTYIDDPPDDKLWWSVPLEDGTKARAPNPKHLEKAAKQITSKPLPLP